MSEEIDKEFLDAVISSSSSDKQTSSKPKKRLYIRDGDPTEQEILAACPEEIVIKSPADVPRKKRGRPKTYGSQKLKWWDENDRIRAATVYAITGNANRTSELTGIPAGTIRQWKTQTWWPKIIERVRNEADDELDVKLTKLINKTVDQINDRLEKGDYYYDFKTGELVRVPMKGKEMAVVTSIMVDKRTLLRGKKQEQQDIKDVKEYLKDVANLLAKGLKAVNTGHPLRQPEDIEDVEYTTTIDSAGNGDTAIQEKAAASDPEAPEAESTTADALLMYAQETRTTS